MSNVTDFNKELDLFAESIDDDVLAITKKSIEKVYRFMVKRASPSPTMKGDAKYSLGSYVQSHRVTVGEVEDDSYTEITTEDFGSENKALMRLLILEGLKPYESVTISNNIPWALYVEMGWALMPGAWPNATHGPYRVYAEGYLYALTVTHDLINYFSGIVYNKMRAK
jgi:hypothetical protein